MGGVFSKPKREATPAPPPPPAAPTAEPIQAITKRRKAAEGRTLGTSTDGGDAGIATKTLLGQ